MSDYVFTTLHVFYTIMLTAEAYYYPKADFDSLKTNPLLALYLTR